MPNYIEDFSKANQMARYDNHNVASNVPDIFDAPNGYQIFHRDDIPKNTKDFDKFYCVFCHKELIIAKTTRVAPYFKHTNGVCEVLSKIFIRPENTNEIGRTYTKDSIVKGYEIDLLLFEKAYEVLKNSNDIMLPDSTNLVGNDNLWISSRFPYIKCYQKKIENEILPAIIIENETQQQICILLKNSYIDDMVRFENIVKENISTIELDMISLRKSLLKYVTEKHIEVNEIPNDVLDNLHHILQRAYVDEVENKKWIYEKTLAEFAKLQKREFIYRKNFTQLISNNNEFWKHILNRTDVNSGYIYIIPTTKTFFIYEKWIQIEQRQYLYSLIQSLKYQICVNENLYRDEFNQDFDANNEFNIQNIKQKILMRFFEDCIVNSFCFQLSTIDYFEEIYEQIDQDYLYTFYSLYVRKKAFSLHILQKTNIDTFLKDCKNFIQFLNYCFKKNNVGANKIQVNNQFIYTLNLMAIIDLYIETLKFGNQVLDVVQTRLIYERLFANKSMQIIKLCSIDKYSKYKYNLLCLIPRKQLFGEPIKGQATKWLKEEIREKKIKNPNAKKFLEYFYGQSYNNLLQYIEKDFGFVLEKEISYQLNKTIVKPNISQPKETMENVFYINNKFRQ